MNPRGVVFAVVSLLGLGVAAWTVFAAGASAPQPREHSGAPAAASVADVAPISSPPPAQPEIADAAALAEARIAAPLPPRDFAWPSSTIRGRCVDTQGRPLSGCAIRLFGGANRERMDQWLREHPLGAVWQNPEPQTTGNDGSFAFHFRPPEPFHFSLQLQRDDLASMSASWDTIASGRTIDLGDVAMAPGVLVQGRVVDEAGRPIANIAVMVRQIGLGTGRSEAPSSVSIANGISGTDGSFRCGQRLAPGPVLVDIAGDRTLANPIRRALAAERPVEVVTVVLKNVGDEATISGRVVDEHGQPIANARIEVQGEGTVLMVSSAADGRFTARQPDGAPTGDMLLSVQHEGFEPAKSDKRFPWGSKDVALTMTRSGALAVHAHDDTGRLITDFTVRLLPRETSGHSDDGLVRARGPFAAGFASVPGVARGKWIVVVDFPSALQLAPVFTPIEVTTTTGTRVDVLATGNAERTLRVLDGADQPVAGTAVQLCLPLEGPFTEATRLLPIERLWSTNPRNAALLLMDAPTGADGTLVLRGPRGRNVALAVSGPGHTPVRQGDVRLDVAGELVVRVSRGARLRGRLVPPEAIAELQRLDKSAARTGRRPSISLAQGQGQQLVRLPAQRDDKRFQVAPDGSFEIDGLPPGTWQLVVRYWRSSESGGATGKNAPAGEVVLRDGETTQVDPDMSSVLPGTLTGVVRKNGAPLANAYVNLQGARDGAPVATDDEGRFTAALPPGQYRVIVPSGGGPDWPAAEAIDVVVGKTTEGTFDVWTGTVTVHVRDANGALVPGVTIHATSDAPNPTGAQFTTDAQGACTQEVVAVTLTFRALPKSLQSLFAQQQLRDAALAQRQADPIPERMLVLGTATVVAGQTTSVELRLPAGWDK